MEPNVQLEFAEISPYFNSGVARVVGQIATHQARLHPKPNDEANIFRALAKSPPGIRPQVLAEAIGVVFDKLNADNEAVEARKVHLPEWTAAVVETFPWETRCLVENVSQDYHRNY